MPGGLIMAEYFQPRHAIGTGKRRNFLKYMLGSAIVSVGMGFLLPEKSQSTEADLERLCSGYPFNSQCKNYLPGVAAKNQEGTPIQVNALLSKAAPGSRIPVKGLPNVDAVYLVITDGPKIAPYAISPVCTHRGCTVKWQAENARFQCPCHGSQYDAQGKVIHGPAKRSLPLFTVVVKQDQVRLVDRAPAIDPRNQ
jgi:cytochrome b6-f complex iron-sulfur subunit